MKLIESWKERTAHRLLRLALRLLPQGSPLREQLIVLLRDLRNHERYEGWCELTGAVPLSFDSWRAELAWVKTKMWRAA
jgi:hypothetical protein